ncbi:MAG: hypothetical protein R3B90_18880 [Planctomycetaceae bacterium]
MLTAFLHDESGFIVSAELVLVSTLVVLGMIVGLSEIQHSINAELNDVADAIGSINQSYAYSGFSKWQQYNSGFKGYFGAKAFTRGSAFWDVTDECDLNQCQISCDGPVGEGPKNCAIEAHHHRH